MDANLETVNKDKERIQDALQYGGVLRNGTAVEYYHGLRVVSQMQPLPDLWVATQVVTDWVDGR